MNYFIVFTKRNFVEYSTNKKENLRKWENDPRFTIKTFEETTEKKFQEDPSILFGIKDNNITNMEHGNINTFSFDLIAVENKIKFITQRINHGYNVQLTQLKEVH
jgi:hypothetical protein